MYKKMKKDAVSPVIAVILMVAITVVLAGVLYVWVTSLADTSETVATTLELKVTDAATSANGATYADGEPLLAVTQTGGNPINWDDYTIKVKKEGTDSQYAMYVYKIDNTLFVNNTGVKSEVGQIILLSLAPSADGMIAPGDYCLLQITSGTDTVWSSANAVKVQ